MSKVVFILGAGASSEMGIPSANQLLSTADTIRKRSAFTNQGTFDFALAGVEAYKTAYGMPPGNGYQDLNIESVFSAFEMANLTGRLHNLPKDQISRLPHDLRYLILSTIEQSTYFEAPNGNPLPPKTYEPFVNLLISITDKAANPVIITFNYDVALDYALHRQLFRYCLPSEKSAERENRFYESRMPYLKLHGSINWGWCEKCKKVNYFYIQKFFFNDGVLLYAQEKPGHRIIKVTNILGTQKCTLCNGSINDDPFIVPPTWGKFQYYSQIESLWKTAAEEISTATDIIALGYSLPPTDTFIRDFLTISIDREKLRRFWVFNRSGRSRPNYENLSRSLSKQFDFKESTFEKAVQYLQGRKWEE